MSNVSSIHPGPWQTLLNQMRLVFYSAQYHRCGPEWSNPSRVTPDEMLHILHRGEICFQIGGQAVHARPGDLICCPPGTPWEAARTSRELVRVTVIHFEADFPGSRRYMEVLGYPYAFAPPGFTSIEKLGRKLCEAHGTDDEGRLLKARGLLYELFHEIFSCRGESAVMDEDGRQVLEILEWMQEHFRQPVTRAALSRKFYLSPQHLATLFRRHAGSSPIEYLIRLRLDEARMLLGSTTLPVQEISRLVGYEDAAYFSRLFKHNVGVAPGQYRTEQHQLQRS